MNGKCYQCGKYFHSEKHEWYGVHKYDGVDAIYEWVICSPSCLVEFAWEQKEGQEKLSKSKEG